MSNLRDSTKKRAKSAKDTATPLTNQLIENLLHGDGIPRCAEWDAMVRHARAMERLYYAQRAVSAALMKS